MNKPRQQQIKFLIIVPFIFVLLIVMLNFISSFGELGSISVLNDSLKDNISLEYSKSDFKVEIGEPTINDKIIISKWDESRMIINLPTATTSISSTLDSKSSINYNDYDLDFYIKENGDFEYDIIIREEPKDLMVSWAVDLENIECYLQKPLDEEKIELGVFCNSTDCWDEKGENTAHRPSNIVDSYACYHNSKKNNGYMTGKAFHIYRIEIIDFAGHIVWTTMNLTNNEFKIDIPKGLVYPIKVDPTFGVLTAGASLTSMPGYTYCEVSNTYTASSGDQFDLISIYASAATDPVRVGSYNMSGGVPQTKLGTESTYSSIASLGWYNITFTETMLNGQTYSVCASEPANNGVRVYYDSGTGTNNYKDYTGVFNTDYTASTNSGAIYSWYAVYTAVGGGGDLSPNVTLSKPPDDTSNTTTSFIFGCNVTDDNNIANTTLWIWNSTGVWNNTEINTSTGKSLNYTFSVSGFSVDDYVWNCLSYDNNTNSSWANANFSLNVTSSVVSTEINLSTILNIVDTNAEETDYSRFLDQDINFLPTTNNLFEGIKNLFNNIKLSFILDSLKGLFRDPNQSISISSSVERVYLRLFSLFQPLTILTSIKNIMSGFRDPNQEIIIGDSTDKNRLTPIENSLGVSIGDSIYRLIFISKLLNQEITINQESSEFFSRIKNTLQKINLDNSFKRIFIGSRLSYQDFRINSVVDRLISFTRGIPQEISIDNLTKRIVSMFRSVSDLFSILFGLKTDTNLYIVDIQIPSTSSTKGVVTGENITIHFNFTKFDLPITDNVNVTNITIGGNECVIISSGGTPGGSSFGEPTGLNFSLNDSGEALDKPWGITNNDTFFWIADYVYNAVFKYWINGTYTGTNFSTDQAGNGNPFGITNNETYIWTTDYSDNMVYQYWIDGTFTGTNWSTVANGDAPHGIIYDGDYLWVTENENGGVFKYWINGTYTGTFFNTSNEISYYNQDAIDKDDTYFYIGAGNPDRVYRYWLNGSYEGSFFSVTNDALGITSVGNYLWVTDNVNDRVYQYWKTVGSSASSAIYNSTSKLWMVNCTVPSGSGTNDLYLQANYTTDNVLRDNTEANSIVYSGSHTRTITQLLSIFDKSDRLGLLKIVSSLEIKINSLLTRITDLFKSFVDKINLEDLLDRVFKGYRKNSDSISLEEQAVRKYLAERDSFQKLTIDSVIDRLFVGTIKIFQPASLFDKINRRLSGFRFSYQAITMSENIVITNISGVSFYNTTIDVGFNFGDSVKRLGFYERTPGQSIIVSVVLNNLGNFFTIIAQNVRVNLSLLASYIPFGVSPAVVGGGSLPQEIVKIIEELPLKITTPLLLALSTIFMFILVLTYYVYDKYYGSRKKDSKTHKVILFFVILVIILILVGLGYYFYNA